MGYESGQNKKFKFYDALLLEKIEMWIMQIKL